MLLPLLVLPLEVGFLTEDIETFDTSSFFSFFPFLLLDEDLVVGKGDDDDEEEIEDEEDMPEEFDDDLDEDTFSLRLPSARIGFSSFSNEVFPDVFDLVVATSALFPGSISFGDCCDEVELVLVRGLHMTLLADEVRPPLIVVRVVEFCFFSGIKSSTKVNFFGFSPFDVEIDVPEGKFFAPLLSSFGLSIDVDLIPLSFVVLEFMLELDDVGFPEDEEFLRAGFPG